jgi:xanthosine utilization system XapX-like protein
MRLDYASPRRKVRKPVPDVVFLFGWMGVFVGMYLVMSLLLVGLLAAA